MGLQIIKEKIDRFNTQAWFFMLMNKICRSYQKIKKIYVYFFAWNVSTVSGTQKTSPIHIYFIKFTCLFGSIFQTKITTQNLLFSEQLRWPEKQMGNLWSWFLWCLCDSFLWCLRLLYSAFECSAPWCSSPTFQSFLSQFLFLLMFWLSHIFVFWFLVFWSLLLRDFLPFFFPSCSSCLAKCKLRYSYFRNFIAKSDQKPKIKFGMIET